MHCHSENMVWNFGLWLCLRLVLRLDLGLMLETEIRTELWQWWGGSFSCSDSRSNFETQNGTETTDDRKMNNAVSTQYPSHSTPNRDHLI